MQQRKTRFEDLRQSVTAKLVRATVDLNVVTMPDFFLDHTSTFNFDVLTLTGMMLSVASRGGGEIADVRQGLEVGGNAAICTLALSKLGAMVHPLMKTDALGLLLMRYFYEGSRVDLSGIKLTGSLSPTTILELRSKSGSTNIMLGDASHIRPFGFEDLDSKDLATINGAHHVCVFNWLYNRKGTALAERVFAYCRASSHARTFFDAADPGPRVKELPDLNRRVLRNGLIDIWGVNENEAVIFAKLYKRKLKAREDSLALEAGKIMSANSGAKVYVHTADYSASIRNDEVALVPAFDVRSRRGTGAGDSWNAGIMVADALGLSEEEALFFANGVAGRYVSNPKRVYSTLPEVVGFLNDSTLRLKRIRTIERSLPS
jgi:sugar/nucleoside kinase (ribokinase family)